MRTQIQLTAEQAKALKALSVRADRSMAELVRRGVELVLAAEGGPSRDEVRQRALAVVGKFRAGVPDGSTRHDAYLAEAYAK